jgi:hypothetical protein
MLEAEELVAELGAELATVLRMAET